MFEVFWLVRLFLEVEFSKLEFGLKVESNSTFKQDQVGCINIA